MSGDVVPALRQRADALEDEARRFYVAASATPGLRTTRPPEVLKLIAGEFRAIADAATGTGRDDDLQAGD